MDITSGIDFNVLKKFNQQGPRYTSYPTAPVFSSEFTDEDYIREVKDTNLAGSSQPLLLLRLQHACDA